MARVLIDNVTKKFDEVIAVNQVKVEVKDKEFLVLVGPSGCGKTTLLRTIAGLEEITEGKIFIGDRLINDIPPKDRNIAMVFQNYALYPAGIICEIIKKDGKMA
ncbi:ATP-binding cassette domain-containing protein, partial [Candidatus Margulisiibacteriota bacterium]